MKISPLISILISLISLNNAQAVGLRVDRPKQTPQLYYFIPSTGELVEFKKIVYTPEVFRLANSYRTPWYDHSAPFPFERTSSYLVSTQSFHTLNGEADEFSLNGDFSEQMGAQAKLPAPVIPHHEPHPNPSVITISGVRLNYYGIEPSSPLEWYTNQLSNKVRIYRKLSLTAGKKPTLYEITYGNQLFNYSE